MLEYFLGTIGSFGFGFIPVGWAPCNGQVLSIAQNEALFALLGTTYGGDGITTFGIPDLRGRSIVSQGTGPGLTNIEMGQLSGINSVTMNPLTMPAHGHTLVPGTAAGQVNAQAKMYVTTTGGGTNEPGKGESGIGAGGSFPAMFSDSAAIGNSDFVGGVQLNSLPTLNVVGKNIPFDITSPMLGINYCICTSGIFPSRN